MTDLHIPATELKVGDVIAHGFRPANQHRVETVGRETVQGHEFVTYRGSSLDGGDIDATVLPSLMLDVRRADA